MHARVLPPEPETPRAVDDPRQIDDYQPRYVLLAKSIRTDKPARMAQRANALSFTSASASRSASAPKCLRALHPSIPAPPA